MRGISWLAANQLASQEGLCTMEWVSIIIIIIIIVIIISVSNAGSYIYLLLLIAPYLNACNRFTFWDKLLRRHRQHEHGHKTYVQRISFKNYMKLNNTKYAASSKYSRLEGGGFSHLQDVYTTSGAHIHFYLMGFELCLSGTKTAGAWSSPVAFNYCRS